MENNHTISGDSMAKRKRGRPRKHLKIESNVQSVGSPPGFSMTQPQIRQRDEDEAMVGQQIHGVIEATFEAGFLVSVKFENSDSVFRGLVFKPGRCDPVSVDNDIAPHLPMIRRNSDVVHHHGSANGGRKSRVRERRGSGVRSRSLVPVPIQPAHPTHHVVPVVLQPVRRQNGGGQVPIQPAHPVVPVKHLPGHLRNGGGQVPVNHGPMQTETGSQASVSGNGKPFETLLTEVMNKGKVHQTSQSIEADSEEQALSIEPLQAIHPVHPVHMPKPVPSYGQGKMTELLQALQENVKETHFAEGQ